MKQSRTLISEELQHAVMQGLLPLPGDYEEYLLQFCIALERLQTENRVPLHYKLPADSTLARAFRMLKRRAGVIADAPPRRLPRVTQPRETPPRETQLRTRKRETPPRRRLRLTPRV